VAVNKLKIELGILKINNLLKNYPYEQNPSFHALQLAQLN